MQVNSAQCQICERKDAILSLIEIKAMPLSCNILLPDRKSALQAPLGDIHLVFCSHCGHVFNRAFDSSQMEYGLHYENSLHYSPGFQAYADSLAQDLVERYRLKGKTIVEIGCGKGDFLNLLCRLGENRGLGFDPSYEEDRFSESDRLRFSVIRGYYSEKYADVDAALVVCRHVLEHIKDPGKFLKSIHKTVENQPDTAIFFEVPNGMYTLQDLGIWDLIYEHCGYFTTSSLIYLFEASGFFAVSLKPAFGNQYICIEVFPQRKPNYPVDIQRDDLSELYGHARTFASVYRTKVERWTNELQNFKKNGDKVFVWGAGSKGITFLNVMKDSNSIDSIVDINPYKQGMYCPGTGHQVIGPEALQEMQPEVIIVMNSLYVNEIRDMLAARQIKCDVVTV